MGILDWEERLGIVHYETKWGPTLGPRWILDTNLFSKLDQDRQILGIYGPFKERRGWGHDSKPPSLFPITF